MKTSYRQIVAGFFTLCGIAVLIGCGGSDSPGTGGTDQTGGQFISVGVQPGYAVMEVNGSTSFTCMGLFRKTDGTTEQRQTDVKWKENSGTFSTTTSTYHAFHPTTTGLHALTIEKELPDSTRLSASARIAVTPPSPNPMTIDPPRKKLILSQVQQFTAKLNGNPLLDVDWYIMESGNGRGSIAPDGVYTAPTAPATVHIAAVDRTDPTHIAVATVLVNTTTTPVVTVSPKTASIAMNGTQQFTATVTNAFSRTVTWSVVEAGGGTISRTSGFYTPPETPGTYHVVATSTEDATATDTAEITVREDRITITITPHSPATFPNNDVNFTVDVQGTSSYELRWRVEEGSEGGRITTASANHATYRAPETTGTYHIYCWLLSDSTVNDTATVTVNPSTVNIVVSPKTATVAPNHTQQFTATVTGTTDTAVHWWVMETGGDDLIDQNGLFTAKYGSGTFTVVATSHADPGKQDTARITIQGE